MLKASYFTRTFDFKFPAGTSRGVLLQKSSSFIVLEEVQEVYAAGKPENVSELSTSGKPEDLPVVSAATAPPSLTSPRFFTAVGECSTIPGLSPDPVDRYESKLQELCEAINQGENPEELDLMEFPSIRFGLEMAMLEAKLKMNQATNQVTKQATSQVTTQPARNSGLQPSERSNADQSTFCSELNLNADDQFSRTSYSSLNDFLAAPHLLFPSEFTLGQQGININGLIWMGEKQFMRDQIARKLDEGFRCLKMKVGALDFDTELEVLRDIRRHFSPEKLEIRVDANGAFSAESAMEKLNALARFQLHSIEQPIRQGQYEAMASLCRTSPIPIALDEELISYPPHLAEELLRSLQPAYIILKPSLLGGFAVSQQWIEAAEATGVGWWVTSALESNIGLNAIAQWTYTLGNPLPQGLGTGQLYTNNIPSWLTISGEWLVVSG